MMQLFEMKCFTGKTECVKTNEQYSPKICSDRFKLYFFLGQQLNLLASSEDETVLIGSDQPMCMYHCMRLADSNVLLLQMFIFI